MVKLGDKSTVHVYGLWSTGAPKRKQTRGGSPNSAHEAPETDEQPLPNYHITYKF